MLLCMVTRIACGCCSTLVPKRRPETRCVFVLRMTTLSSFTLILFLCPPALSRAGGASQNGSTALIYAVQYHHANCVRLLLDAGADAEAKDRVRPMVGRCQSEASSFLFAFFGILSIFSTSILQLLFSSKIHPQHGSTALMCAASGDDAECVQLLIDAGADTEDTDYVRPRSLLCCAASASLF